MVKQFNRNNLPKIGALMDCALVDVGNQFGIKIDVGSASFTAHGATFKVKLSILNEAGESKQDKSDFMRYALYRGFDAKDYGRDFTSKGRQFKITGWCSRKWKFPVTVKEVATGDTWHFPVNCVLRALGRGVPGSDNQMLTRN